MLTEAEKKQREKGVQLWLVGLAPEVLAMVQHSPLGAALGRDRMFFISSRPSPGIRHRRCGRSSLSSPASARLPRPSSPTYDPVWRLVAVDLPTPRHASRGFDLMDSAYFSAFAALAGSVIGGLTSLGTTWLTQHSQLGAQRSARNLERRETLYRNFVDEASRLYADAFEHDKTELSNLVKLFALITQMRLVSSPKIVEGADQVARLILATYLAPNKTFGELQHTLESHLIDPLIRFSEACREELQLLGAA